MAQQQSPGYNRRSLIASVLLLGVISLVQPGCDCGSSGTFTPAVVASVFPEQNTDTALVSTAVIAFFGIDMDETTIDQTSFTLTEVGGTQITGTVTYDAAERSATLVPASDLVSGTQYAATISASVQDAAGNTPLANDFVWSFTVSEATELISRTDSGAVGNNASSRSAIDGSGRYVVFVSQATNLATTPTTLGLFHVYRKDTQTGEVRLVSSTDTGLEANNNSSSPRTSDDGRYVVFSSFANNLSPITTGSPQQQVYIKDMETGDVALASRDSNAVFAGNNASANPDVSNDGRYVVFESAASNLSALPANGFSQIYRKDMSDDSIDMISRNTSQTAGGLGSSNRPRMSPDARFIVFDSTAGGSLVTGASGERHVYLVDMNSPNLTEQASVDSNEVQASGTSRGADISEDGMFVAFESNAANLVAGGTGSFDVYRRDRTAGETLLASTPDGATSGDVGSFNAAISGDGNFVAFESAADNLVAESVSGLTDIFVRDFSTLPTVTIDKVNLTQTGLDAGDNSANAAISSDGRYVSFDSLFNLDISDTNTLEDVYRSHNSTF